MNPHNALDYRLYSAHPLLKKHRAWAEIDTSALSSNYHELSNRIKENNKNCRMICVVKADAYGHGADACVSTMLDCGADFFAVSCIEEAIALKATIDANLHKLKGDKYPDILILGYTPPAHADLLIRYNFISTVFSYDYANSLANSVRTFINDGKLPKESKLPIHIKLDTGMNRLGFSLHKDEIDKTISQIKSIYSDEILSAQGMFTHFARADELDSSMTNAQFDLFMSTVEILKKEGICPKFLHASNSAGAVISDKYRLDGVRIGILLYGLAPSSDVGSLGLKPVMKLKTIISHIHTLHMGDTVSYGGRYKADSDRKIATLTIGYADGFLRAFSNGAAVSLPHGKAKIVGNICMDQCMVDITGLDANVGDTVTVFGDTSESINELAKVAGTINYEIICILSGRVPRIIH